MHGAEPFAVAGGPDGVLVLHGFTGNPQSMRPLAEALASGGFTVELPLLPGHGTSLEDMLPTRWEDWSGAAEAQFQALAARCDHIAVVGLSMGGALACWLAERHPHLSGIALVNPLVHAPGEDVRSGLRGLLDADVATLDAIGSDIKKEGQVEASYPGTPVAALLSLLEAADDVEARLPDIHCPVLVLSSREDHVVESVSGDTVEARVSGPVERVWLEDSYHVATLDNDAPLIEALVTKFVTSVFGGDA
jgi:carboxylesterase